MTKISGFVHRHLGAAIAGISTAVVLVGGVLVLTLAGPGGAATAGASAAATTTTTLAPAPTTPSAAAPATKHQGVRGQIVSQSGTTWTVMSARGVAVTVELTPSTVFGSKATPLTASDFAPGDQIVVVGTRSKATVTATRIAKAPAHAAAPSPTTTVP